MGLRRRLAPCALLVAVIALQGGLGWKAVQAGLQADQELTLWVRRPKVRLRARVMGGGGGVPVLFVHGLAGDMGVWAAAMAHERGTRRAGAFDLRGHGASGIPKGGFFSIPSMGEDAAAVAEAFGFRRYVLVGHSLGAAVVASCAGRHPDRVAGVFLLAPPNRPEDRSAARGENLRKAAAQLAYRDQMNTGWGEALQPFPASRDRVLSALARTPPEAIGGVLAGLAVYDPLPDLRKAGCPLYSLTLSGADSPRSYHVLVPSIAHGTIDGVSHWAMLDAPEEFGHRLDAFLAKVDELEVARPGGPRGEE